MQCKCGAEVKSRDHEVKTLNGAKSWLEGSGLEDCDIEYYLPLQIEQKECSSCKRFGFMVWAKRYTTNRFDVLLHSKI